MWERWTRSGSPSDAAASTSPVPSRIGGGTAAATLRYWTQPTELMPVDVIVRDTAREAVIVADAGFDPVLGVTARGATVKEARDRAYAAADAIRFEGVMLRRDIASRALER